MAIEKFADAIAMLEADHRTVEGLFGQFEQTGDMSKKAALAQEICTELKIHSLLEEEYFYPACRGKMDDRFLNVAQVEHDGAKILINDILTGEPASDAFYEAKVLVLSEEIQHHVNEEERPSEGVFAQARGAGVDLVALRDSMLARKKQLLEQSQTSAGLPSRWQSGWCDSGPEHQSNIVSWRVPGPASGWPPPTCPWRVQSPSETIATNMRLRLVATVPPVPPP